MNSRQINVLLFGASGVVGTAVLRECLADPQVAKLVAGGRTVSTLHSAKANSSEETYAHVTYGFTLAAANTLVRLNPHMTFVYVSGLFYSLSAFLLPLLRTLLPNHVLSTTQMGLAMLQLAKHGYAKRILETRDSKVVAGVYARSSRVVEEFCVTLLGS